MRLHVVAVAAVLVVAGCTLGPGGGTPTGEPSTATPSLSELSYPPGVTDGGVNVTALLSAHRDAIDGRSFTMTVDGTFRSSFVNFSRRTRLTVDEGWNRYRRRTDHPNLTRSWYVVDGTFYERVVAGERPTYETKPVDGPRATPSSGYGLLNDSLVLGNYTVERATVRNGTPAVVLTADEPRERFAEEGYADVEATLVVDEAGLVREYRLRYVFGTGDDRQVRTLSMAITGVDATTVGRPAWLDRAPPLRPGGTRANVVENGEIDARLYLVGSPAAFVNLELWNGSRRVFRDNMVLPPSRASSYVRVVQRNHDARVDRARFVLGYDEARVPRCDERGLSLYRMETGILFERVDSTVHPDNDTVTATLSGESLPGVFVVLHTETYRTMFRGMDAKSRGEPTPTPPARCTPS